MIKKWIYRKLEIETIIADTKVKAIIVGIRERLRRWAAS
jgi:hypothetical protein